MQPQHVSRPGGITLLMVLGRVNTMFNVGFGIWGLFALHGEQQLAAAFTTAFGLMILWILFGTERTDRFFEQN